MSSPAFQPGVVVDTFSEPGAVAPGVETVERLLDESEMFVLTTVRPDGRPHSVPLPAMWLDGALHFCTGAAEQKARNLSSNPLATLSTTTRSFRSGIDVVVEGAVTPLRDERVLARLAALWLDRLDWPFDVVDGAFADPTVGNRAEVFRLTPSKVLVFTKGEPYGQVRYRPT